MHAPVLPRERIRGLKRAEYEQLVESGAIREDERVELLYGAIVRMSPQGHAHHYAIMQLTDLLVAPLKGRARVCIQLPIALSEDSEPEPDVSVVPFGDYADHIPTEAFLIIEVADTSLQDDQTTKRHLYAAAGVPEYWIVDVIHQVIEAHRKPIEGDYTISTRHLPGETLAIPGFSNVILPVAELFARR
jgi:Uma2 family endonuclease